MLDVFHAGPNRFSSITVYFECSCAVDVQVVALTESVYKETTFYLKYEVVA
jgi:acetamidase/formamidase